MSNEYFKQKIKAFLHDPPEKPLILGLGKGHEATSREYVEILFGKDEPFDKKEWEFADHVASAADRTSFPLDYRSFKVSFRDDPIIKHPNSGKEFDLEQFKTVEPEELKKNVTAVLHRIADYADGDYEKAFLYLWRYFPELARNVENGNDSLGLLWNYLPADTRIPDHSVLDHARIVSAFAGAGIKNDKVDTALLLFTIGPVQEFIAAARKTKDLWAGSYMLSWLSWQGMRVFCEELGPDSILFPDLKGQPLVDYWLKYEKELAEIDFEEKDLHAPTLPNRFFAVVPKEVAAKLARNAEEAVTQALLKVGQHTFDKLSAIFPEKSPGYNFWEKQLSNFVQCYWASLDLPEWNRHEIELNKKFKELFGDFFLMAPEKSIGNKQQYRDDIFKTYDTGGFNPNIGTFYGRFYEIVEKAVGSRKALRDFSQLEESGYRCSLIPNLAALAPVGNKGKSAGSKQYREFWEELYNNAQNNGYKSEIGKNERLSPLALSKRFFPDYLKEELSKVKEFDTKHFNSTHALAVADFKFQLVKKLTDEENEIIKTGLQKFLDSVEQFQQYLNLQPENPLFKIRWMAEKAPIDCQMNTVTFCALPGELLQTDYYDGNFSDDLVDPDSYKEGQKQQINQIAKKAKEALNDLIKISGLENSKHPSKYYAILYLDGDHMGKWLSGDKAPEFWKVLHKQAVDDLVKGIEEYDISKDDNTAKKYRGWKEIFEIENGDVKRLQKNGNGRYSSKRRPQAPTQHMAISRALNNYSLKLVRTIVEEEFLGRLIYAGGDDVVAMISLQDALPCAEKLRAAFSGHLKSKKNKTLHHLDITLDDINSSNGYISYREDKFQQIVTTLGPEASASCGIAVAHYMYPLKQAIADARKAEKYAKEDLGRDAFAVNIVKRSGETTLSGAHWRLPGDGEKATLVANGSIKQLADAFLDGKLSPKFIVDIEDILDVLVAMDKSAVLSEIRRIYNQHNDGFKEAMSQKEGESDKEFIECIRKAKSRFFDATIYPLIQNCDELGNTDARKSKEYRQKEAEKDKPADWINLRNAIRLIDMAHYIGKGGGR